MQEYRTLVHLMDELDQQRRDDATAMRGNLALLAVETGDELARTKKDFYEVLNIWHAEPPASQLPPP